MQIRVICSGVGLGTMGGARPALSVAAPAVSDPHQSLADCEDWEHRSQESDTSDNPCVSPPAVRAEEQGGLTFATAGARRAGPELVVLRVSVFFSVGSYANVQGNRRRNSNAAILKEFY
jgi:hypothetical protein